VVKSILQDPSFGRQLAAGGRKRVVENFSSDKMVEGMIAVYNSVLNTGTF